MHISSLNNSRVHGRSKLLLKINFSMENVPEIFRTRLLSSIVFWNVLCLCVCLKGERVSDVLRTATAVCWDFVFLKNVTQGKSIQSA